MILGIDASNIRGGGGVTHLRELLRHAHPEKHGFDEVIVWGGRRTLDQLEARAWMQKKHEPLLDGNLIFRTYWQYFHLKRRISDSSVDVVFFPGGLIRPSSGPFVSMSQNLLPFEPEEMARYPLGLSRLRLNLLRRQQLNAFRKSRGVIFLSNYARDRALGYMEAPSFRTAVIPHGIDQKFFSAPKIQREVSVGSGEVFNLLYVSFVGEYKHQWNLVRAVRTLRGRGYPLHLTLVGAWNDSGAIQKLQAALDEDPDYSRYITILKDVEYNHVQEVYRQSDLFLFLSSCETFGQILTEAMANGLPVLCSKMSSLPEIGSSAVDYINPLSERDVAEKLERTLLDRNRRQELSQLAYSRASQYDWSATATATFEFFRDAIGK